MAEGVGFPFLSLPLNEGRTYGQRPGDTCHGRTDSRTRSRRARASAEFHFRVFA